MLTAAPPAVSRTPTQARGASAPSSHGRRTRRSDRPPAARSSSQRPAAAVHRAAGQPAESVVDSLDGQHTGVGPGRDLADPGSPGRPEGAPYLGGIGRRRPRRCCGPRWTAHNRVPGPARTWTCRCPPAAAPRPRAPGSSKVSACACAGSSSGQGAPTSASRCQPPADARTRPVSGRTSSGSAGSGPGLQGGDQPGVDRVAVVQQRDLPVWRQHAAQPAAHPPDRQGQLRPGLAPRGPEQPGHVDQVGEHLDSGRRGPARNGRRRAGSARPAARSAGPAPGPAGPRRRRTPPARPAP